jgi:hypothetical protein
MLLFETYVALMLLLLVVVCQSCMPMAEQLCMLAAATPACARCTSQLVVTQSYSGYTSTAKQSLL